MIKVTQEKRVIQEQGDKGEKGDTGNRLPTGGTTGQQLVKKSNADYDLSGRLQQVR